MTAPGRLLVAMLVAGCAEFGDPTGELEDLEGIAANGVALNGTQANGKNINGVYLNGKNINGRYLNGLSLGGIPLADARLEGSEIVGTDAAGQPVRGAQLVGATLESAIVDMVVVSTPGLPVSPALITLRIDGVTQAAPDISYYWVSYNLNGVWLPACGWDGGFSPLPGIFLAGRWDYSEGTATGGSRIDDPEAVTLACAGAALAKCAEFGYRPWAQAATGLPMVDLHQSCTRMVRADYCGDGMSNTLDGWEINLWDRYGVQVRDTTVSGFNFDAAWGPTGATCVRSVDGSQLPRSARAAHCWDIPVSSSCGASFDGGSYLVNEARRGDLAASWY